MKTRHPWKSFIAFAIAGLLAQSALAGAIVQKPIKDRIEFGIETSSIVRKYDVKVKAESSEIILTGTVATEEQKAEVERLAKVAGAARIQNAIVVNADEDRNLAERIRTGLSKAGEKINDDWVSAKVSWFLMNDDLLTDSAIKVDVDNRIVTLKGDVRSTQARSRAVALATDTEGVKRVVDKLTIVR